MTLPVKKNIEKEFRDYLEHNDNNAVSPSNVWDAAKAVISGKLITIKNKEKLTTID